MGNDARKVGSQHHTTCWYAAGVDSSTYISSGRPLSEINLMKAFMSISLPQVVGDPFVTQKAEENIPL